MTCHNGEQPNIAKGDSVGEGVTFYDPVSCQTLYLSTEEAVDIIKRNPRRGTTYGAQALKAFALGCNVDDLVAAPRADGIDSKESSYGEYTAT